MDSFGSLGAEGRAITRGGVVVPLYPVPARSSGVPEDDGFRAELRGMSLYDLVQLECNRSVARRVLFIVSGPRTGHVYFEGGQVVHASTDRAAGERALFEMLGWSAGVLEEVERPWPDATTIRASWQSLLMRAAHHEDEARRSGVTESSPRIRVPSQPPAELVLEVADAGVKVLADEDQGGVAVSGLRSAVRLGRNGDLLKRRGDVDDLAPTAAFVGRLVDLVGESLGLEGFVQLDAVRASARIVVAADADGFVAAEGERGASADDLRKGASV